MRETGCLLKSKLHDWGECRELTREHAKCERLQALTRVNTGTSINAGLVEVR